MATTRRIWREIDHPRGPNGRFIRRGLGSSTWINRVLEQLDSATSTSTSTPTATRRTSRITTGRTTSRSSAVRRIATAANNISQQRSTYGTTTSRTAARVSAIADDLAAERIDTDTAAARINAIADDLPEPSPELRSVAARISGVRTDTATARVGAVRTLSRQQARTETDSLGSTTGLPEGSDAERIYRTDLARLRATHQGTDDNRAATDARRRQILTRMGNILELADGDDEERATVRGMITAYGGTPSDSDYIAAQRRESITYPRQADRDAVITRTQTTEAAAATARRTDETPGQTTIPGTTPTPAAPSTATVARTVVDDDAQYTALTRLNASAGGSLRSRAMGRAPAVQRLREANLITDDGTGRYQLTERGREVYAQARNLHGERAARAAAERRREEAAAEQARIAEQDARFARAAGIPAIPPTRQVESVGGPNFRAVADLNSNIIGRVAGDINLTDAQSADLVGRLREAGSSEYGHEMVNLDAMITRQHAYQRRVDALTTINAIEGDYASELATATSDLAAANRRVEAAAATIEQRAERMRAVLRDTYSAAGSRRRATTINRMVPSADTGRLRTAVPEQQTALRTQVESVMPDDARTSTTPEATALRRSVLRHARALNTHADARAAASRAANDATRARERIWSAGTTQGRAAAREELVQAEAHSAHLRGIEETAERHLETSRAQYQTALDTWQSGAATRAATRAAAETSPETVSGATGILTDDESTTILTALDAIADTPGVPRGDISTVRRLATNNSMDERRDLDRALRNLDAGLTNVDGIDPRHADTISTITDAAHRRSAAASMTSMIRSDNADDPDLSTITADEVIALDLAGAGGHDTTSYVHERLTTYRTTGEILPTTLILDPETGGFIDNPNYDPPVSRAAAATTTPDTPTSTSTRRTAANAAAAGQNSRAAELAGRARAQEISDREETTVGLRDALQAQYAQHRDETTAVANASTPDERRAAETAQATTNATIAALTDELKQRVARNQDGETVRNPTGTPARRGDLVVLNIRSTADYQNRPSETTTTIDVYRVAGVNREGRVTSVLGINDTGRATPLSRLDTTGRPLLISQDVVDIPSAINALRARDDGTGRGFATTGELRDFLTPNLHANRASAATTTAARDAATPDRTTGTPTATSATRTTTPTAATSTPTAAPATSREALTAHAGTISADERRRILRQLSNELTLEGVSQGTEDDIRRAVATEQATGRAENIERDGTDSATFHEAHMAAWADQEATSQARTNYENASRHLGMIADDPDEPYNTRAMAAEGSAHYARRASQTSPDPQRSAAFANYDTDNSTIIRNNATTRTATAGTGAAGARIAERDAPETVDAETPAGIRNVLNTTESAEHDNLRTQAVNATRSALIVSGDAALLRDAANETEQAIETMRTPEGRDLMRSRATSLRRRADSMTISAEIRNRESRDTIQALREFEARYTTRVAEQLQRREDEAQRLRDRGEILERFADMVTEQSGGLISRTRVAGIRNAVVRQLGVDIPSKAKIRNMPPGPERDALMNLSDQIDKYVGHAVSYENNRRNAAASRAMLARASEMGLSPSVERGIRDIATRFITRHERGYSEAGGVAVAQPDAQHYLGEAYQALLEARGAAGELPDVQAPDLSSRAGTRTGIMEVDQARGNRS